MHQHCFLVAGRKGGKFLKEAVIWIGLSGSEKIDEEQRRPISLVFFISFFIDIVF